jgi:hypothetical protein
MGLLTKAMNQKDFVHFLSVLNAGGTEFGNTVLKLAQEEYVITRKMVVQAEAVSGLRFTEAQRELLIPNLEGYMMGMEKIRGMSISPEYVPALFSQLSHRLSPLNRWKSREG